MLLNTECAADKSVAADGAVDVQGEEQRGTFSFSAPQHCEQTPAYIASGGSLAVDGTVDVAGD